MPWLFARRAFTGFGPHGLQLTVEAPPLVVIHARRSAGLRARVRLEAPRRPGVYGMVDERGELIYVGKSKCLRSRLLSYFRARSRDPKAGDIVRETRLIAWEPVASDFGALLRELELIRRWQPRFNVQGQPHRRRRTFVCLGRRPAPHVFLSARPARGLLGCYGPLPAGNHAREAVRRLNDWYRLRDCPRAQEMVFSDQQELFPMVRPAGCIRYDIATCLGPCAAACSRDDYEVQVRSVRRFLEGEERAPLEQLEREMLAAASALEFERAGALRDKLKMLQWLWDRLAQLRTARAHSSVYPVASADGGTMWYLIERGAVRMMISAPNDETSRARAAEYLRAVYQPSADRPAPRGMDYLEGVFLVAAWFRKYEQERQRLLVPEAAMQLCQRASCAATPGTGG